MQIGNRPKQGNRLAANAGGSPQNSKSGGLAGHEQRRYAAHRGDMLSRLVMITSTHIARAKHRQPRGAQSGDSHSINIQSDINHCHAHPQPIQASHQAKPAARVFGARCRDLDWRSSMADAGRMLNDRIDKLRAVVQSTISIAKSLESRWRRISSLMSRRWRCCVMTFMPCGSIMVAATFLLRAWTISFVLHGSVPALEGIAGRQRHR